LRQRREITGAARAALEREQYRMKEATMFGTIGHARLKSGRQSQLETLNQEWQQTIRPKIPGDVVQLTGHRDGQPEDMVFVALVQDKATYQQLAAMPEQDAWYRRMTEQLEGDVRWEDVEMERVPS
jgi:hypothetical protein